MSKYIHAAIMTSLWAVAITIAFPPAEFAAWFAWALSVGGAAVASYNYIVLIDKVRSGEITIEDLLLNR